MFSGRTKILLAQWYQVKASGNSICEVKKTAIEKAGELITAAPEYSLILTS